MKPIRIILIGLASLFAVCFQQLPVTAETPPDIASMSKPQAGSMQMLFHGQTGPFQVQKRLSLDPAAPWSDVPGAKVTEVNPGVYMAVFPIQDSEDIAFYRVLSLGETIAELKGWTIKMKVSSPTNG